METKLQSPQWKINLIKNKLRNIEEMKGNIWIKKVKQRIRDKVLSILRISISGNCDGEKQNHGMLLIFKSVIQEYTPEEKNSGIYILKRSSMCPGLSTPSHNLEKVLDFKRYRKNNMSFSLKWPSHLQRIENQVCIRLLNINRQSKKKKKLEKHFLKTQRNKV